MTNNKDIYDERHRFWTEQALNQFGNASNFFFLITLGFFAFLFPKEGIGKIFCCTFQISALFYTLTLLCNLISLLASGIPVLSRLHDLRLTRHIVWIRKKRYDNYTLKFPDDHMDLRKDKIWSQVQNFISTLRTNSYFITDEDLTNTAEIDKKFSALRKRNLLLARFSWLAMNSQILFLLLALFFYTISQTI